MFLEVMVAAMGESAVKGRDSRRYYRLDSVGAGLDIPETGMKKN